MSEKLSERLGEFSVFGVVETIMDRGEWMEFHIMLPGNEHPFRASTKNAETIEHARQFRGPQGATWHVKATLSEKLNPKTNKPYVNRFLNGVEQGDVTQAYASTDDPYGGDPGQSTPAAAAPTAGVSSDPDGMTPEKWDAKERRDYRSRSWAHTMSALTHTIKVDEDLDALFLRLQHFQRKVYVDITGTFAYPPDGDDIPF